MTGPKVTAEFSFSSLQLFAELLGQAQLPPAHPNLVELAGQVVAARDELGKALESARPPQPNREQRRSAAKTNGKTAAPA